MMAEETVTTGQAYIRHLAAQADTARNRQQAAVVAVPRQEATVEDAAEVVLRRSRSLNQA
jgi:hypothetical protein